MVLNLDDFEVAARSRLPRALYGFAANGSERGASVLANARSFERWSFVPRTLVDVASVKQATTLFGTTYASPFGIAPMGGCALFAHRADLALAQGARARGIPFVLSAASSVPLEQVMQAAPGSWYQGYIPGDEARITALLARLRSAQVGVLVVTVDVPIASNRDRDRRLGFTIPLKPRLSLAVDGVLHPRWLCGTFARTLLADGIPRLPNFGGEATGRPIIATPTAAARSDRDRFTWAHVAFIRRQWGGALLIKGVLSADDARLAREAGVDGLIVSNHGGRQLDGAAAPLDVLPEVLDAAGELPVCLDGSIRRGTDALKALALGARLVFVGRPMLYAATVGGQAGVEQAIGILQSEIQTSLALLGCTRIDELRPSHLRAP
ncbi:alpha-hydroxy acid oxidase [Hydrogenophaga sp. ANAO-22]|uniref:alpha-hydroxy acid oxidase n=1 Tax=Hydrogenophaga sp. ANAO-22 TaxID=3166645 RepID=UPI0036D411AC